MKVKKRRSSARTPKKSKKLENRFQGDWPMDRQVMERPERYKYVRKLIHIEGCVFCQARDRGVSPESLCIYKDELAMLVLNKFPYNSGHVMVIPTRHCGDLNDLTEEEHMAVQRLLKRTVAAVKKIYRVDGLNIGLNMGTVAGAGLPDHLHWHIVPRWLGDTNFFPLIAQTKIVPETLAQTYDKYAGFFKG